MMRLGGQTITVYNRTKTGTDRLGAPIYSETPTVVAGCSLQGHGTHRQIDLTDTSVARYRLFAPASAPLTDTSRVVADGVSYLMNGQPALWKNARGRPHHIECHLMLWDPSEG